MPFQITILEADLSAYEADPPTPSGLPKKFCACYNPFWQPEAFGSRKWVMKAFGDTPEEAVASLKEQIKELLKYERIARINEITLFDVELK